MIAAGVALPTTASMVIVLIAQATPCLRAVTASIHVTYPLHDAICSTTST